MNPYLMDGHLDTQISNIFIGVYTSEYISIDAYLMNGHEWLKQHINKNVPNISGPYAIPNTEITIHNLKPGHINRKIYNLILNAQNARKQGYTHIKI